MTTEELNTRIGRLFGMSERVIDRMNGHVDRKLVRMYSESLKNVRGHLAAMYEKYGDSVKLEDMTKYNRLRTVEANIEGELKVLGNKSQKTMKEGIRDNFTESYYHAGYALETPLETSMGFGGLDVDTIRAAQINPLDRIKWPDRLKTNINTLNRRVRGSVIEGLVQGYGFSKTAREVKDKIERTAAEAVRIVRTESQRAKSVAHNLAYEKSQKAGERLGIETKQVWDATLDTRTRPEHARLDGKAADEDGQWRFSDGVTTSGPVQSGVPAHDINCRCTTVVEVGEFAPEVRRDQLAKKTVPYKSYEEWAKEKGISLNDRAKMPKRLGRGVIDFDSIIKVGGNKFERGKTDWLFKEYDKYLEKNKPKVRALHHTFQGDWGQSSNSASARYVRLRAQKIFGINDVSVSGRYFNKDKNLASEKIHLLENGRKKFLEEQKGSGYIFTDADIDDFIDTSNQFATWYSHKILGSEKIKLYRGFNYQAGNKKILDILDKFKEGDILDIELNTLNSFATNRGSAKGFASKTGRGYVIEIEAKPEDIFMSWMDGNTQWLGENEFIISGAKVKTGKIVDKITSI